MSLSSQNINPWRFWSLRLVRHFLMMLLGCVINFPILIYLIIPVILWFFADIPYTWPTTDYLMKWVRYGLVCTLGVGVVVWLSEFLPWIVKVIRSRHSDWR